MAASSTDDVKWWKRMAKTSFCMGNLPSTKTSTIKRRLNWLQNRNTAARQFCQVPREGSVPQGRGHTYVTHFDWFTQTMASFAYRSNLTHTNVITWRKFRPHGIYRTDFCSKLSCSMYAKIRKHFWCFSWLNSKVYEGRKPHSQGPGNEFFFNQSGWSRSFFLLFSGLDLFFPLRFSYIFFSQIKKFRDYCKAGCNKKYIFKSYNIREYFR